MSAAQPEDAYVMLVYRRIIALALTAHVSFIALYAVLGFPFLAAYNVASSLFYCAMLWAVGRGYYRLAVASIHIEVCLFASLSTLAAGWDTGTPLYLVAITSLTYFCPFRRKYIPYLFSLWDILVFLTLRLYTGIAMPGFLAVSEAAGLWMYFTNALASFVIILYAAFSANVSAAVTRRELQDENRSLSVLANYDQLTGLLNRRAFLQRLAACRDGSSACALALGDIDDFKRVNDTWGHPCGDQVLGESAELMRQCLGSGVTVCRWGGEEFVFLFRDMPFEEALARLEALREAVAQHPFHCAAADLRITMTIGVTPEVKGLPADELVARADRQMYRGKRAGKNRVACESR